MKISYGFCFLILSSVFLCTEALASESPEKPLAYTQKTKIYNIPYGKVVSYSDAELEDYLASLTPSEIYENKGKYEKNILSSKNVKVILKDNKNKEDIFNELLELTKQYANNEGNFLNYERVASALDLLKITRKEDIVKDILKSKSKKSPEYLNDYRLEKFQEGFNLSKAKAIDIVRYFILNYKDINKDIQIDTEKDTRLHLVRELKEKLSKIEGVDTRYFGYDISQKELEGLYEVLRKIEKRKINNENSISKYSRS